MESFGSTRSNCVLALALGLLFTCGQLHAQDVIDFAEAKPVPVLTGSTAYFTRVTAGQVQDAPSMSPLLLLPIGNKLLIESKGSLSDTFAKNTQGDYAGTVSYGL